MTPERFFETCGFSRRPDGFGGEGAFAFRMRCEYWLGIPYKDPNPLRERLYRMWRRRAVGEYPVRHAARRPRWDYSWVAS